MSKDFFFFLKGELFPLYEWNLFYIRIYTEKKNRLLDTPEQLSIHSACLIFLYI